MELQDIGLVAVLERKLDHIKLLSLFPSSLSLADSLREDLHGLFLHAPIHNLQFSFANFLMALQDIGLVAVLERKLDHVARFVLSKSVNAPRRLHFHGRVEARFEQVHTGCRREGDTDTPAAQGDHKDSWSGIIVSLLEGADGSVPLAAV